MFTLDVQSNYKAQMRRLQGFGKQVTLATAKALTFTAEAIQDAEVQTMRQVFDRPTAYTLNSLRKKTATVTDLTAAVYFKDPDNARQHYLLPQVDGGTRPQKRSEQRLAAWMFGYSFMMPGQGARLNSYGNLSASVYTQVLGQLGSLNPGDNETARSKKRHANAGDARYFVAKPGGHLRAGIYQRSGKRSVKPIFVFTTKASYKPRFFFYQVASDVAGRVFPQKLDDAIEREMRATFAAPAEFA